MIDVLAAPDYPDIEIVIGAGGLSGDSSGTLRNMIGLSDEFYRKVFGKIIGKVRLNLMCTAIRVLICSFHFLACFWTRPCFIETEK